MNPKHTQFKRLSVICAACLSISGLNGLYAQSPKSEYFFPIKPTPEFVRPYSSAAFAAGGKSVQTLNGREISSFSDTISAFEISPAGINFLSITKGKKGNTATIHKLNQLNEFIYKFNNKVYGIPKAIGYTPDARNYLLANEKGIQIIEPKKFDVVRTIPNDFIPSSMLMSSDGYYLAVTDGHNIVVYNFEEGKPRKTWKFDETVTGMKFSPDNSRFAILTNDGLLEIYDTRAFGLKQDVDDLGEGIGFDYNLDGKYVAVITSPSTISVINLLRPDEREIITVENGNTSEVLFIPDSQKNTILNFNESLGLRAKRMPGLEPYYGKLMSDEVASLMNEWLEMKPGETMEQYRARVNDESRARQQRLFEDEISTRLANNLISMASVTLGKYDRTNQMLEVDFNNMPSIFLPVPESEVTSFGSGSDLVFSETQYGLLPNDSFELIYAKVHNKGNGKNYIYDNLDRHKIDFLESDDNFVSIAVIQQQQMEEMKLQELRERVVEEAKSANVISNHTNISVKSRVEPSYDANGEKILNYIISFSYEVEPGFSASEDFGPGKYHIEESGAASSMTKIIREALEGDFAQYIKDGKKLNIKISGTADSTPIIRNIPYDGVYGDFEDEIVYKDGTMTGISVNSKKGISENEQLAFLRAYGVKDFLDRNIENLKEMTKDYRYDISVAQGKGSEFRRITTDFTFIDAF